jgi:AcrR family transcriptional regulator
MLKTLGRLVHRARKRRIQLQSDRRRAVLISVGQSLLARDRFEDIPVSRIAAEANCSVGAFYGRFTSKDAFLFAIITAAFDAAIKIANRDLDQGRWRTASIQQVIRLT